MSKFVKEGSIPKSDLQLEEIRALKEELIFLKQEELKTRKSLQEQLYENRVRKAAEYQELTSKLNSSYKINEKDMEYYEILRKKEEMRELDKQIQEEENLEEFRRHRIQIEVANKSKKNTDDTTLIKVQKRVAIRKRKPEKPVTFISGKRSKTTDDKSFEKQDENSSVTADIKTPPKTTSVLLAEYESSSSDNE